MSETDDMSETDELQAMQVLQSIMAATHGVVASAATAVLLLP